MDYKIEYTQETTCIVRGGTGGMGGVKFCCTAILKNSDGTEITRFESDKLFGYGNEEQRDVMVEELIEEYLAELEGHRPPHPTMPKKKEIRDWDGKRQWVTTIAEAGGIAIER
jgi:hypothetical protein